MLWPMRGDRHTDEVVLLRKIAGEFVRAAVGEAENGVVAVEKATLPVWLADVIAGVTATRREDGTHLLRAMRRSKDAVEQRSIRANVRIAEAGYMAAKEVIGPGRTELDVYQAMRKACEDVAGTSVPLGGDFAAGPGGGVRGGPPSTRALVSGESYVIDLWPSLGGYWADLCRTYPIGAPIGSLARAVGALCDALDEAERLIGPGVVARDVDQAVRGVLARHQEFANSGHLHISGHGIGLEAHESPWLVGDSDDVLVAGDVIAVEPGLYSDDLAGGARVEDDYLVTTTGCERLSTLGRRW
jgi:Xaa-Pro dipeptidase